MLSRLQEKILFYIRENPGISLRELSMAIGRSKMVLHYNTHILEDAGVITQRRRGKISTYYLTPKADFYFE